MDIKEAATRAFRTMIALAIFYGVTTAIVDFTAWRHIPISTWDVSLRGVFGVVALIIFMTCATTS